MCLGYINLNKIKRLVKSRTLHSLVPKNLPVCDSCIKGKMTKRPFTTKGVRAKECLKLVYTNVCEPLISMHMEGMSISHYYKYCYVYLVHWKFNILDKFKEFKAK